MSLWLISRHFLRRHNPVPHLYWSGRRYLLLGHMKWRTPVHSQLKQLQYQAWPLSTGGLRKYMPIMGACFEPMFYSRASPPLKKRFVKAGLYIPGPVGTSISTPHHWMSPSFVCDKQLREWTMRDWSSRWKNTSNCMTKVPVITKTTPKRSLPGEP